MNSSDSLKELAPALAQAQSEFKAVGKSGQNTYDRYSYANLEDYVRAVRPTLAAHGLSLVTSVEDVVPLDDRTTKNGGTEHAVRVKLAARLLHTSGEWVEAHAWGEGQDRADKAVYKAITGARKYALASALGLATSDDPEADEAVGQAEPPKAQAKVNRAPKPESRPEPPQEPPADAPPAEPDRLSNDAMFRAAVFTALDARGFDRDTRGLGVAGLCTAYKVNELSQLTLEQRHSAIAGISEGRADKWKPDKPAESGNGATARTRRPAAATA